MEDKITAFLVDVVTLYPFTMVGIFLLAWFARTTFIAAIGTVVTLVVNFAWLMYVGAMHFDGRWPYDASRHAVGWLITIVFFLVFGALMRAATSDGGSWAEEEIDDIDEFVDPTNLSDPESLGNPMKPTSPLNMRNR